MKSGKIEKFQVSTKVLLGPAIKGSFLYLISPWQVSCHVLVCCYDCIDRHAMNVENDHDDHHHGKCSCHFFSIATSVKEGLEKLVTQGITITL